MVGIDNLRKNLKASVGVVNGLEALRAMDLKSSLGEVLDLDEAEALTLAKDLELLDLTDDAFEKKIETLAATGASTVVMILRVIRLFVK